MENADTSEIDYYGDFTNLQEPGTYFIRSQTGVISHTFTISSDPFEDLRRSVLRMFSYQRCGSDLTEWAGALSHPACHTGDSNFECHNITFFPFSYPTMVICYCPVLKYESSGLAFR